MEISPEPLKLPIHEASKLPRMLEIQQAGIGAVVNALDLTYGQLETSSDSPLVKDKKKRWRFPAGSKESRMMALSVVHPSMYSIDALQHDVSVRPLCRSSFSRLTTVLAASTRSTEMEYEHTSTGKEIASEWITGNEFANHDLHVFSGLFGQTEPDYIVTTEELTCFTNLVTLTNFVLNAAKPGSQTETIMHRLKFLTDYIINLKIDSIPQESLYLLNMATTELGNMFVPRTAPSAVPTEALKLDTADNLTARFDALYTQAREIKTKSDQMQN